MTNRFFVYYGGQIKQNFNYVSVWCLATEMQANESGYGIRWVSFQKIDNIEV